MSVYRGAQGTKIADHPRLLANTGPMANLSAPIAASEPKTTCTTAEWRRALERAGVPHLQIRAPNLTEVEQPRADPLLKIVGQPVEFSAKRREVVQPVPLGDEHSRGILAALDHGRSEIDALIDDGAFAEFARWANAVNP